jgi:hypothetical protein
MKKVYARPKLLKPAHFHYCPGCGHGIINRLIMEIIEEMDLQGKAICVAPAGCGMLLYKILWNQPMDVALLWQQASNVRGRKTLFSHIKATAILLPLVPPKGSTRLTEVRTLPSSSSTTVSMA